MQEVEKQIGARLDTDILVAMKLALGNVLGPQSSGIQFIKYIEHDQQDNQIPHLASQTVQVIDLNAISCAWDAYVSQQRTGLNAEEEFFLPTMKEAIAKDATISYGANGFDFTRLRLQHVLKTRRAAARQENVKRRTYKYLYA